MGEGDPLPRGKELTEGPIGIRGSYTHAQTNKQRDWSHRISWCQVSDCGRIELSTQTLPLWVHGPGSGVALC